MKAICKTCSKEFKYDPTSSRGIFCSTKCRAVDDVTKNLRENTHFTAAMRKYVRDTVYAGQGCSMCPQDRTWNSKPLTLQVDHINGNKRDNRIENLRLLCPNCHTQTETWGNPMSVQRSGVQISSSSPFPS